MSQRVEECFPTKLYNFGIISLPMLVTVDMEFDLIYTPDQIIPSGHTLTFSWVVFSDNVYFSPALLFYPKILYQWWKIRFSMQTLNLHQGWTILV